MDTSKNTTNRSHNSKSELEKFKLFYELVVPEKESNSPVKSQRPVRRNSQK